MRKQIIVDILRHGEPVGGEVLRGRVDHPLSDLGWQQMKASAASVSMNENLPWSEVITSSLQRCRAFGDYLAQEHKLPVQVEDRWQEIDYGDWDGMLLIDWRKAAADQFREFRKDLSKLAPPNGEAYLDFKSRILDSWQTIAEKPDGSHVLLITHGGVMRVVIPSILGIPFNQTFPLTIPFACLSRVQLIVENDQLTANFIAHNLGQH